MRYAKIRKMDISNGIGISCSIFTQGCTHHCNDCFNKETWDFEGGKTWDSQIEYKFIELCKNPHIDCINILGGEPLDQSKDICTLLQNIKNEVDKPIYLWTGYLWEDILKDISKKEIMKYVDVLIDGKFEKKLQDFNLKLCGSSNQRIIDVQTSLLNNKITLYI